MQEEEGFEEAREEVKEARDSCFSVNGMSQRTVPIHLTPNFATDFLLESEM